MDSKNLSRQIEKMTNIVEVYYKDEKIWVLLEDESDIMYCEPFPKVDGIEYNIVDDEKDVPTSANRVK